MVNHIFKQNYKELHRRTQPKHQAIERVTVVDDAHFKSHHRTKTKSAGKKATSDWDCPVPYKHHRCCVSYSNHFSFVFCIRMRQKKNPMIMVFIYPPARLITLPLVPLTALAHAFEFCRPAFSGSGTGWWPCITLCISDTFTYSSS